VPMYWMMRAVVDGIDPGTLLAELFSQPLVNGMKDLLGVQPAGDAGLIGHNDRLQSYLLDQSQRLPGPRVDNQLLGFGDVTDVFINSAVAVDEYSRCRHSSSDYNPLDAPKRKGRETKRKGGVTQRRKARNIKARNI